MNLLAYDGPLAQTVRAIWRYFLLNFIYIICCLPIVTIGAATTALYSVMLPSSDNIGCFRKFFNAFRSNFAQATIIWLTILIPLILLGISLYLTTAYVFLLSYIVRIVLFISLAFVVIVAAYVFPLQARYVNPPRITLRNAFVLSIGALLPGLLMGVIALLPIIIFFLDLRLFLYAILLWQFAGFALVAKINSLICMVVFSKLDSAPETTDKSDML